jgi:PucR C-terminal helix-turn-helix domain
MVVIRMARSTGTAGPWPAAAAKPWPAPSEPAVPAEPWPALSADAAELMWPHLGRITEEMADAIQRGVAEYARPLDAAYANVVHEAVGHAVHHFVDRIANPAASREPILEYFNSIGRGEAFEGRSLEPLQSALRLCGRVAWRAMTTPLKGQGTGHGEMTCGTPMYPFNSDTLSTLAEAIFSYLDELAGACAEGYEQAKARLADEMERRRRRLLDLIVADPPASPEAIADLARAASWRLPRRVAAVAVQGGDREHLVSAPSLPGEVLMDLTRRDPCLILPDTGGPGRAELIENGLRGCSAAIGPAVPLARASSSLRWARQALALARRGVIVSARRILLCDEHLSTLMILSDEELVRTLGAARLAPLRRLRSAQQDRLAETMLAWLQNSSNAQEAARSLHVHPQTVRYRLRQLDELFGDTLRDPNVRFELEVALRARVLLAGRSGPELRTAGTVG